MNITLNDVEKLFEKFESALENCGEMENPQEEFKLIGQEADALYYAEMYGKFDGDEKNLAHYALRNLIKDCEYARKLSGNGSIYQYTLQTYISMGKN